jgi:hypothetical protein
MLRLWEPLAVNWQLDCKRGKAIKLQGKNNMISPIELAGIAIYSLDIEEINSAIRSNLHTNNKILFGECARAIGHIARRFGVLDSELINLLSAEVSRFPSSKHVRAALVNLRDDLRHFVNKQFTDEQEKLLKPASF